MEALQKARRARCAGAAFARDGRDVWVSAGVRQRRLVRGKGCKHLGCTRCVGATLARGGRDIRSSIGNDAGQRDRDGSHVGETANMEVAPAARGQRSSVTEETRGVVPR